MGLPFTYIDYTSDSGGVYMVKQQNALMQLAGNTQSASSNVHPGLPRNIRPRSAQYLNAGRSLTLVIGSAADYAAAPAQVTFGNIAYTLAGKTPERVRVLRP